MTSTTAATTTTTTTTATGLEGLVLTDVSELVKQVRAGVVTVTERSVSLDMFLRPVESEGTGTGIVIDDQGHILTNFHVIQNADQVTVFAADNRPRAARVIGGFAAEDLALLEITDLAGLTPLPLGSSEAMEVGDPVIAIGNALGLDRSEPTVSVGFVSAKDRTIQTPNAELTGLLQTDAAINPGNSGGPLLNAAGEVVGINTAIAGNAQNIGFAIAVDRARPLVEEVLSGIGRPFVGISLFDNSTDLQARFGLATDLGIIVTDVLPTGPAAAAGLQVGDIVVGVDGTLVEGSGQFTELIGASSIGTTVTLTVVRGQQQLEIDVTIDER